MFYLITFIARLSRLALSAQTLARHKIFERRRNEINNAGEIKQKFRNMAKFGKYAELWKYGRNLGEICEIRQKSGKSGESSENLKFRTGYGLVSNPSVMSESGRSEQAENGSCQNQNEGPISHGLPRRASKEVLPLWEASN